MDTQPEPDTTATQRDDKERRKRERELRLAARQAWRSFLEALDTYREEAARLRDLDAAIAVGLVHGPAANPVIGPWVGRKGPPLVRGALARLVNARALDVTRKAAAMETLLALHAPADLPRHRIYGCAEELLEAAAGPIEPGERWTRVDTIFIGR